MSDYEDDYGGYSSPESYGGYSSEEDCGKHVEIDPEKGDHAFPAGELVKPFSRPNFGSYETGNTSKFLCEDYEDGKKYSAKFSQAYKAQDFVEKRTGNPGFKEEAKYDSSYKVDDKIGGSITEYKTQVKTTKKVTITNPSSNDYINIDKNSSSSSYVAPKMPSSFKHLNIK